MVESGLLIGLAELGVLVVGVVIALQQLRDIKQTRETELETRQAQLFMGLYEAYRNPEFRKLQARIQSQEWEDFDEFWEKFGSDTNPEAFAEWLSLTAFFNGVGVLLHKKLIDINLAGELLSNILYRTWAHTEPILEGFRLYAEREGFAPPHTRLLGGFEYLYNEVRKREELLATSNEIQN